MSDPATSSASSTAPLAALLAAGTARPAAARLDLRGLPWAVRAVLRRLAALPHGQLELQLPDGRCLLLGARGAEPAVRVQIHDLAMFGAVLRAGDIGLAEAYIAGAWHTADLAGLLRLLLRNRGAIESLVYGSRWGGLLYRLRHRLNRNSRGGSRRNIHAHYDLGNAFYRLWLDGSMNYSSACFDGRLDQPLEAAQQAKMARALDQAGVGPGSRVLEIGCGWGAVAEAAARRGAQLTGVTLSTEQLAYARERLERAGLAAAADLRLQDYRDIGDPPFDALVSIEMFEAVGREYWPSYFEAVRRGLRPGGRACIQTITIRDALFERYARSTDFIQQYIFPGGLLPSPSAFRTAAQAAGLVVEAEHAFGPDYAETLRRWHVAFIAREDEVRRLGFDTRFLRTWSFYLAYCEAAFDAGDTDVVQFTLRRP